MRAKLTVGIIGCGGMGTHHTRGYLASGRFDITAISDPNEEAMDKLDRQFRDEEDYRPDRFTDLDAMLDSQSFDVISVCVWHREHAPCTIAAATRRPKAILCEKPMAENTGRADEMRMVCERNGVKLAIAHQRRFLPSYTLAKSLIADGAIGEVEMIYGQAAYGLPNWSSHHADMFRYLLDDECAWVMGGVSRRTDRMERGTELKTKPWRVPVQRRRLRRSAERSDRPDISRRQDLRNRRDYRSGYRTIKDSGARHRRDLGHACFRREVLQRGH